ncbi:heavy-metal-associated domain-containing protein [Patescibacteria group bacterium]|nr:heavy-metal-associated domain-containing protein [Patescibacteria group bacterium]
MVHIHQESSVEDAVQKFSSRLKDFIPLIVIFSIIFLFTAFMLVRLGRWDLVFAMRSFMGAFFVIFGGFKIINWKGFVDAYSIYDILAKRSRVYGYLYPLIELGLGFSYLFALNLFATNAITLFVMGISSIGVFNELGKGKQIPCACLGTVFKIPMTKVTLLEDILMAGMALWMLLLLL